MNLYEAIYARRSVRRFLMEPIENKKLESITEKLKEIKKNMLFPEIKMEVAVYDKFAKREKFKGLTNISAPYYAAVFTEQKEKSEMNAGFVMQQLSLFLTTQGIGSCFLGTVTKIDKKMDESGLYCVIVMAFGLSKNPIVRREYEAKRLAIDELCFYKEQPGKWVSDILKVARLAPSCYNSQPWRFVVYENRVHVFSKKSTIKHGAFRKFNEFNFGIMFANIMIAADEFWIDVDLIRLGNITHKNIPNNQYILSILAKG